MFGFSTFGIAMALLKWLPLKLVDKILLLVANFTFGNTDQLGLRRPKTGPLELKNATGKTPVLDVGALSQIKSGKIKVINHIKPKGRRILLWRFPFFLLFFELNSFWLRLNLLWAGDGRCERDNKKWK